MLEDDRIRLSKEQESQALFEKEVYSSALRFQWYLHTS